ncbi:MAG: hypothetical protein Q4D90_11695, partial [bacterium]|nr:hypothetical protein [bacterium]
INKMSEMNKMSDMADKKIVVMGGSFNPPTLAHSYFAVVTREQKEPERAILGNPHLSVHREHFVIVPEPEGMEGISSTAVRNKIKKNDESAAEMLDPRVWKMLVENSKSWIEKDTSGTIQ